jgi:wyosine [tRNA(Phe)-imidazoG37] synthetase (radical SAM superfamily)
MTTSEKVIFLIEGFNNFHNAIAYTSNNNSHIPFRVIITSPDHNASSHTIEIENDNELNEILVHFEKKLSKNYKLEYKEVDVRFSKDSRGYMFFQYLTV